MALITTALLLSGCATGPTRDEPDAFDIRKEGRIARTNTHAFADCLLDGFDKAHFMMTNVTSRQQRRSDSYRVETLAAGRMLVVSADVFDDGRVVLNEAKSAALVNTSGERSAFDACLRKFAITL